MVFRSYSRAAATIAGLAWTLAAAMACGGKAATGAVDYSVSAEKNYKKGLAELAEEDWIAAAKYFSFIKARFPYSRYAVLAELRLADSEFGAGNYLQAIDSYKLFVTFHPTHEMIDNGYVAFRIGECYYKMLPTDWWILPPAYEKDQSATVDARRELKSFLRRFPSSKFVPRAKKMLADVEGRLAMHEWYVAQFYWQRNKPMGTVLRLRNLLKEYPGVGFDGEALWLLGQAYMQVNMPDRAKTTWEQLVNDHPNHDKAKQAKRALRRLSS